MAIDHDKLLSAIDAHAENAYGGESDSALQAHRSALLDAFLGHNTNPAPEGRSQVVDRSVFETVMTSLPSLVRIFAGSDEVVKFLPVGPEDEKGAEQTTAYVSWLVTQQNQWEQICADAILDALTLPNAYIMAYWDESERVDREEYEGQTDAQLAVLLQDESVRVLEHSQEPDEEQDQLNAQQFQMAMQQYQQAAMQAQQQGMQSGMPPQLPPPPEQPQPAFLHDVVLERSDTKGKLRICVLPPEHCIVSDATPDWTLRECPYFEYRQEKTIADLRAMGLDVPDDISDSTEFQNEFEDDSRDRFGEGNWGDADMKGPDRRVVVRTVWVNAALEDEMARYYRAILVGRTPLYVEATSRIHVVSIVTQPMPHRHPGMPLSEMVLTSQEIKTAIKRGGLDNLYLANNGRHAISDKVNLDDFLDSRPGGVVRLVDGALPGEGHVFPLQHPFAFDSIIGSLEYFDQDRQNTGGVNRYFSGTDAGAINKTASGTMALQNQSAQRVEHVARMMAPAFEDLFSIVHELICKHQNKKEVIQLKGEWTEIDPTAWKTRRDVKISVGVGAGNKDSMLQNLAMTIQMQMALAPLGVANAENVYNAVTEQMKLQGFSNPGKFWTDPKKNPPQPQVPPEVQKAQMEIQADQQKTQATLQADQQKFQAEAMLKREESERAAQQAQQDAMLKMQLERERAEQDAALERYKAELQAQTALQIKQMELGGQIQIKEAEFGLQREVKGAELQNTRDLAEFQANQPKEDDGSKETLAALAQAIEKMSKPKTKTVLRDSEGKLIGVKEE